MGLLDILNGIGNSTSSTDGTARGGGMSPIMTALLGLLAYKALAGGGAKTSTSGGAAPGSLPTGGAAGGSLGDILGSVLGGRLDSAPAGGAAGSGQPGGSLGDILGGILGGRSGAAPGGSAGGSLGEVLGGLLGGKVGGAQGGNVLSDALSNIVRDSQKSGHGAVAQSWVGRVRMNGSTQGVGSCSRTRRDFGIEPACRHGARGPVGRA